jgi:hypothetical protein
VNNLRLLRALIGDLTEMADNLETLEDACYTTPRSSRYGSRPIKGQHSDPTARAVAKYERARFHLNLADKTLRGPLLSLMGRLAQKPDHSGIGGASHHVHMGMKALSNKPDQRARHEAGEAPTKESA